MLTTAASAAEAMVLRSTLEAAGIAARLRDENRAMGKLLPTATKVRVLVPVADLADARALLEAPENVSPVDDAPMGEADDESGSSNDLSVSGFHSRSHSTVPMRQTRALRWAVGLVLGLFVALGLYFAYEGVQSVRRTAQDRADDAP